MTQSKDVWERKAEVAQVFHSNEKRKTFMGRVCVCVCVCVGRYTGFCYLFGTFSGINTDQMRTSSPHGDQKPVQIRHDLISEVLV